MTQDNNNNDDDDDDLVECHVSSEEHAVITYIQVDAGSIEVCTNKTRLLWIFHRNISKGLGAFLKCLDWKTRKVSYNMMFSWFCKYQSQLHKILPDLY